MFSLHSLFYLKLKLCSPTTNHQPPTTNLNLLSLCFLFLCLVLLPCSCAKEKITEPDWKSQLENISEEELRNFDDKTAIEIGESIGGFFDEITKDGLQEYINRTKLLKPFYKKDQSQISLEEIATIYKVDEKVIIRYLETLHKNKSYITDQNNRINVAKGIYVYAGYHANRKTRWLFRTIANVFNAKNCGFWQHAARIADTAALTAATVTVPIGSPLTAVGAVSSYVETVDYVIKCCPDC